METIYRVVKNKDNPYVMINKEMVNDNRLTSCAKGIQLYILSKPDNWRIYESEITKHFKDGIKSIRSGISNLISVGYIHRRRLRAKQGQFCGWQYFVYESPVNSISLTEMPFAEVREGHPTNNDSTKEPVKTFTSAHCGTLDPSWYVDPMTRKIADQTS